MAKLVTKFIRTPEDQQQQRSQQKQEKQQPWYNEYPAPKQSYLDEMHSLSQDEVLALLRADSPSKSFVLIDLRGADHEGGTICGSINLPAQSMYHSMPTLYRLFKCGGVEKVVWYCGSSRGRGPRAAAWFADFCVQMGDTRMKSVTLGGGIKKWAAGGQEFIDFMDGYQAAAWVKEKDADAAAAVAESGRGRGGEGIGEGDAEMKM